MIFGFGYGTACEGFIKPSHTSGKDHMCQICHILKGLQVAKLLLFSVPPITLIPGSALAKQMFVKRLQEALSELGEGFEPSNVGFADRYVRHFATRALRQEKKDSNSRLRFWRPPCYHCTILLSAEAEGFEPSKPLLELGTLAGCCLQPLGHTSNACGNRRTRTCDPMVNSHPLCH